MFELPRTATVEGFIHPIHIGPALLIFRYGISGALFYIVISVLILYSTLYIFTRDRIENMKKSMTYSAEVFLISYFTAVGLSVQFLMQDSLREPLFGFTIAILASQLIEDGNYINNEEDPT
jgi:hypothetical protein